jgi:hypothetical protein
MKYNMLPQKNYMKGWDGVGWGGAARLTKCAKTLNEKFTSI